MIATLDCHPMIATPALGPITHTRLLSTLVASIFQARGSTAEQWKRKTVMTSSTPFPCALKRAPVVGQEEIRLSPLETSLDAIQARGAALQEVIASRDVKILQQLLQGSVLLQVGILGAAAAVLFGVWVVVGSGW